MAHKKVGVYRRYLEPIPKDSAGAPLPRARWPRDRAFCWVARWFGDQGTRHSRSFGTKKQAQAFARRKEEQLQSAWLGTIPHISLRDFYSEHARLMRGSIAEPTLGNPCG